MECIIHPNNTTIKSEIEYGLQHIMISRMNNTIFTNKAISKGEKKKKKKPS